MGMNDDEIKMCELCKYYHGPESAVCSKFKKFITLAFNASNCGGYEKKEGF